MAPRALRRQTTMSMKQYACTTAEPMTRRLQVGNPPESCERSLMRAPDNPPAIVLSALNRRRDLIHVSLSCTRAGVPIKPRRKSLLAMWSPRYPLNPVVRRLLSLLLSLILSFNGLGVASARSGVGDCCREYAQTAVRAEKEPCHFAPAPKSAGLSPDSSQRDPIRECSQQLCIDHCPHCIGVGASTAMLPMSPHASVSLLIAHYEAPPYQGAVIPGERPGRLERPPSAPSLN